jgi:CHAT domain-containing protein/Tfp pilus assembly protein PilF
MNLWRKLRSMLSCRSRTQVNSSQFRTSSHKYQSITATVIGATLWHCVLTTGFATPYRTLHQQNEKQNVKEITVLEGERSIEAELSGGQAHTYLIKLSINQILNVFVDQKGIDVELKLSDPAGKTVAGIDWGGKDSTESMWKLAEVTGDYKLEVASTDPLSPPGRYIVKVNKIVDLATASQADKTRVNAHDIFWKAGLLRDTQNAEARHKAIEKFKESLPLWREIGDPIGEANALNEIGFVYGRLGDRDAGLPFYKQALQLFRSTRQERDQAMALANIGLAYSVSSNPAEALTYLKEALKLSRVVGDRKIESSVLNSLGFIHNQLGNFQDCLDYYSQALALKRAIADRRGEAIELSSIGGTYQMMGDPQQAFNFLKQALPLRRAIKDRSGEAITLSNIGRVWISLGEPQLALDYLQQSLVIAKELGDRNGESLSLDAMGAAYLRLGEYQKSIESHNQSLAIRRVVKNQYAEGDLLNSLGSDYFHIGDWQKAMEYYRQALDMRRTVGDPYGEIHTIQNIGNTYKKIGDRSKAYDYLNQALVLCRTINQPLFEAESLYDLAVLDMDSDHLDEARSRIGTAINIIESTRARVVSTDTRVSFFASKQDYYELYIDLLMQLYAKRGNRDDKIKAFGISELKRARNLLDSLGQAQLDIRQGASPELLKREHALQLKLNYQAQNQIKLLSGKHTQEQAIAAARDLAATSAEYEQASTDIKQSSPHYSALVQPNTLSLKELQSEVVDSDTLLLEYSLGETRSYLWSVSSTEITSYQLPNRSEIEAKAHGIYDLLLSRNQSIKFEPSDKRQERIAIADAEFYKSSSVLSRMLLGPVAMQLKNRRLLVVTDGALQYVPFAALPVPETNRRAGQKISATAENYHPLISQHEIVTLPSASVLGILRRELAGREQPPKSVAVLADPVFTREDERVTGGEAINWPASSQSASGKRDPHDLETELVRSLRDVNTATGLKITRLAFTRQEANAIVSLTPDSEHFKALDFQANLDTITGPEMSSYRIVHIATHALLNNAHPELSGLILSMVDKNGNDRPGFLPAQEIYNLKLPVDLVVLSACETGLGKEIKGEGLMSLTRGFMYAGSARVAVSLWKVGDESTAELMKRFYGGMFGKDKLSPAAALRAAQLSMWKSSRWQSPYSWAGFILQGEPK